MVRVGVLLSGCGVYDGAEIHESVIALLALDRAGAEVRCMAPAMDQLHVVDHRTGEVVAGATRDVLAEAARIARGAVEDVAGVDPAELDALVIPGGFGAAKNLCDFAVAGAACTVQPDVARLVLGFLDAGKPIGACCIAPAMVAAVLRDAQRSGGVTVGTGVGATADAAAGVAAMGIRHLACPVDEIREDEALKLVTTPAYMEAGRIAEAAVGIELLVARVLELAEA